MAGPVDEIKSYLVSLGFSANQAEYRKFQQILKESEKVVGASAGNMAGFFVKAGATIIGILGAIGTATIGLMDKVAQADLGYQKFALDMHIGVDAAKKMKIAMDALGESPEHITWIPELRERYKALIEDQKRLDKSLGSGFEDNMKRIRDMRFEFTRFKVELTYGAQALVNAIFKGLGFKEGDISKKLKEWNDWIIEHLPEIVNKIRKFVEDDVKPVLDVLTTTWKSTTKAFKQFSAAVNSFKGEDAASEVVTFADAVQNALYPLVAMIHAVLLLLRNLALLSGYTGRGFKDFGKYVQDVQKAWKDYNEGVDAISPKWLWRMSGREEEYNKKHKKKRQSSENITEIGDMPMPLVASHQMKPSGVGRAGAPGFGTLDRIAGFESGGNYNARHPVTGAAGKYQILPSNWPSWAKEAGLSPDAPMTPENQDRVGAFKWKQYLTRYQGNEQLAAAAWFTGPGNADRLAGGNLSVLNYMDANRVSVGDYIARTTGRPYEINSPITVGDVNISVPESRNSPEELREFVMQGVESAIKRVQDRQIASLITNFQGVMP